MADTAAMGQAAAGPKERLKRILDRFKSAELSKSSDLDQHYKVFEHGNEAPGKPKGFLNSGGFGETYSLEANVTKEKLILKKIPKHNVLESEDSIRHFSVELAALEALDHPNINKKRDLFHTADKLLLVVDTAKATPLDRQTISTLTKVWGGTSCKPTDFGLIRDLGEYIRNPRLIGLRTLNKIRIRIIMKQILLGLQYLHHGSIIHRDIKPENVVVGVSFDIKTTPNGGKRITERFDVKIIDFGLSKIVVGRWQNAFTSVDSGMMQDLRESLQQERKQKGAERMLAKAQSSNAEPTTTSDDTWGTELDQPGPLKSDFNGPVLNSGYGTAYYLNCDFLEKQLNSKREDLKFFSTKLNLQKADVFAAGATFYYMLHGRLPFVSGALHDVEDFRRLQARIRNGPTIDRALCNSRETVLLLRMLSPDPNQCPTVDELLKDPYFDEVGDSITYTERKELIQDKVETRMDSGESTVTLPAPLQSAFVRPFGGQAPLNTAIWYTLDEKDFYRSQVSSSSHRSSPSNIPFPTTEHWCRCSCQ